MLHRLQIEHPEWGPEWAWSHETDTESRKSLVVWAAETGGVLLIGHDEMQPWQQVKKKDGNYVSKNADLDIAELQRNMGM